VDAHAVARRALGLIDLTDLNDDCTAEDVSRLCDRAVGPHGAVAAVCVWPRFVAQSVEALAGTGVTVATVVNFPAGGEDVDAVVQETEDALLDGADEIDLVMPYRAFLERRGEIVVEMLDAVRTYVPIEKTLKVILETGSFPSSADVASAAALAIGHGADFIKTSTGKSSVSATPDAARTMLEVIRDSERRVGIKPSGGIRTLDDAAGYLAMADEIMGTGWVSRGTFRFGASGLLDAVEAALG
jgi:deoxyribose-phosphate aldolase